MAEWLRPQVVERSMGVLTLRDNKLSFADQANVGWEIELSTVKRVAQTNDGRALLIVTINGDEYVAAIMDPSMARISPKKAVSTIERAVQLLAANR